MKSCIAVICGVWVFGAAVSALHADIVPADRRIDWSTSGVLGGIPHRTQECANIRNDPYKASASLETTTGSIAANSNQLVVASALGYQVGHGIVVYGTNSVYELSINSAATAAGKILLTLEYDWGSSTVSIDITAGSTVAQIIEKIRRAGYNGGWTLAASGNKVTITANTRRARKDPSITVGTTGINLSLVTKTPGEPDIESKVVSINGKTITIAHTASRIMNSRRVEHDDSQALDAAIAACGTNRFVFIPSGTYRIHSSVAINKSNITVRGAGADKTILYPSGGTFSIGSANPIALRVSVSGAVRNSKEITLTDSQMTAAEAPLFGIKSIGVGALLAISRDNEAGLVYETNGANNVMRQMVRVTAVNQTTRKVQFEPALYWNYNVNTVLKRFSPLPVAGSGIEDLKIDHTLGDAGTSFTMDSCYQCWAKGIYSYKSGGFHSTIMNTLNCEVRDSFFNDSKSYGPNNAGISIYPWGGGATTAMKIENNIFYKTFPGIEMQRGADGIFAGYNYGSQVEAGWEYSGVMFDDNHGPHNMMNLWEGNVGEMFQSDGYFGSGSHTTLYRNHFTAYNPGKIGNFKAISLNRWSYFYNIVGNILGHKDWNVSKSQYEASGTASFDKGGSYSFLIPVIYQLGYPNMGNNGYTGFSPPSVNAQALDTKVKSTLLRWGNYDYHTKATHWDASDIPSGVPVPPDRNLPASLVYSSKPGWWPVGFSWPPIGPDVGGLTSKIPAEQCFQKSLSEGEKFNAISCYSAVNQDVKAPAAPRSLSVTAQ